MIVLEGDGRWWVRRRRAGGIGARSRWFRTVWPYFRFPLGFCGVEELVFRRGVIVWYGTVRRWCLKGRAGLCRRAAPPLSPAGGKWYLDEVVVRIQGRTEVSGADCRPGGMPRAATRPRQVGTPRGGVRTGFRRR